MNKCETCLHYVEEWNAIQGQERPAIYRLCGVGKGFVAIPLEETCKKWEPVPIDEMGRGDSVNG